MKKSRITLLIASVLSLGLGIGGVLALDVNPSNQTQEVTLDDAIYLYWGDDSGARKSSITIEGVDNLSTTQNRYRYLSVLPNASSAAEASITLTYTLSCQAEPGDSKLYDLHGLTLNVYRTATDLRASGDNPNLGTLVPTTLVYDGTKAKNEITTVFEVSSTSQAAYYCLEFVLAAEHDPATGHEWGGKLTISQDFTTPAA